VAEETGHTVEVERLLGVDSMRAEHRGTELALGPHRLPATVVGGALRCEKAGSTDRARCSRLTRSDGLERNDLVDIGSG